MLSAISFGVFCRSRALDQRDHAIEEGRALRRRDAHLEPIRDDERAAGDGGTIAAGLSDHRRRLARDCRLVDRGHALDHLAVRGDEIAGLDQDHLTRSELAGVRRHDKTGLLVDDQLGLGLLSRLAQRRGLRLAAALGDSFGEIGEQHGDPQPDKDLEGEAEMVAALQPVANEDHGGECSNDLDHEHDRILHHQAWIELGKGRADSPAKRSWDRSVR